MKKNKLSKRKEHQLLKEKLLIQQNGWKWISDTKRIIRQSKKTRKGYEIIIHGDNLHIDDMFTRSYYEKTNN
jgi:hypothetical protein